MPFPCLYRRGYRWASSTGGDPKGTFRIRQYWDNTYDWGTDSATLRGGSLSKYFSVIGMEIGQKVKVYRLRDRVSSDIVGKLGKVGTVTDFKMTDGSGVGVVVKFGDKTATWFFEDEIKAVD